MRDSSEILEVRDLVPGDYYHIVQLKNTPPDKWIIHLDRVSVGAIYDKACICYTNDTSLFVGVGTAWGTAIGYRITRATPRQIAWFQKCIAFREITPLEDFKFKIIT